jgi:hypothetical protein
VLLGEDDVAGEGRHVGAYLVEFGISANRRVSFS